MDFTLSNQGTISVLTPTSEAGREWVAEHLPTDAMSWCGGTVIEHGYVPNIVYGIEADGLAIEVI